MSISRSCVTETVENFSKACDQFKPHSIAWQAGWFQSMCVRLICYLDEHDKQQEIDMLNEQIEEMEKQYLFDQIARQHEL